MTETKETPETAPLPSAAARGKLVTIFVGPAKFPYAVHRDLICYHSEYFRAACKGPWKEAEEGVTLEDVEPEVFNLFVHWLYTYAVPRELDDVLAITEAKISTDLSIDRQGRFLLLKASILGNRFIAVCFKRQAHNAYVQMCGHAAPWYEHVNYAFKNLPHDDLLLKHLVDCQCYCWEPEMDTGDEEHRDQLPNTFLVRVMHRNYAPTPGMQIGEYFYSDLD